MNLLLYIFKILNIINKNYFKKESQFVKTFLHLLTYLIQNEKQRA